MLLIVSAVGVVALAIYVTLLLFPATPLLSALLGGGFGCFCVCFLYFWTED